MSHITVSGRVEVRRPNAHQGMAPLVLNCCIGRASRVEESRISRILIYLVGLAIAEIGGFLGVGKGKRDGIAPFRAEERRRTTRNRVTTLVNKNGQRKRLPYIWEKDVGIAWNLRCQVGVALEIIGICIIIDFV